MKRLFRFYISVLIALLAGLVFLVPAVVGKEFCAVAAESPGSSAVPMMGERYGTDVALGQATDIPWRGEWGSGDPLGARGSATTGDPVVATAPVRSLSGGGGIVSDDFNACSLDTDLWTFINPKADATYALTGTFSQDAWLSISVPADTDHDIWKSGNFAPRIMQVAQDEDFEIEVKFESGLLHRFEMQGLLVEQDSDDFLRFEFYGDGSATRLYAVVFEPGTTTPLDPDPKYNAIITGAEVAPLYMRVRREGNQWTQSYSFDGTSWTTPVTFTHALSVTAVGVYAANADGNPPPHTGIVDYFFNTASPIVAEDGDRNALTVYEVGGGSVITEPAKASYSCGEVVTLTAQEDPGWTFAGWSGGGLSGTDETVTVTMTGSRVVTATFTQDEYTLEVNSDGQGSVRKDPDQLIYHYNDVVRLTAQEDPGWTFAGWSGGGLSGTDKTVTVTMTGDLVVTATFIQDEYTLEVTPDGQGSVRKDPDQLIYHYNDVVRLTAQAEPGWTFAGWSGGGLSGTDKTVTVTMTGDLVITATFTQDQYALTVNIKGRGTVTVEPSSGPYHYGDVVTLTAQADPGWTFAGWNGGDLSGTDETVTVTMTGDRVVTATFNTQVFLPFVTAQYPSRTRVAEYSPPSDLRR